LAGCGILILGFLCWLGIMASAPLGKTLGINRVLAGFLLPIGIVLLSVALGALQGRIEARRRKQLLGVINRLECPKCHRPYESVAEWGEYTCSHAPGGHWVDCPHCGTHREFQEGELTK
jgi:hypothetical protein